MQLTLVEDDEFYFDPVSAEKPVTFIETYLKHYEERFAGRPFLLTDWQKTISRDLFGWKYHSTGLRRFRELYLEIAKGNGKSPFISALAMFVFYGLRPEGCQIFSIATDKKQANITFDMAKKMLLASPVLKARTHITPQFSNTNYPIIYDARNARWEVVSGTAEGKHGFRPDVVVFDEVHEASNRKLYDNVSANMIKRAEPLMLMATNAGTDRNSICWELHERAERVLIGDSLEKSLYPVIYATSAKDDWTDEATWQKANPSLGVTITIDALRNEFVKAKQNPALESKFRRLNLSQWVESATKWIDLAKWDEAVKPIPLETRKRLRKLPLYIGVDFSVDDDMTAIGWVWIDGDSLIARVRLFMSSEAAKKYEDRYSTPFYLWSTTPDDSKTKHLSMFSGDATDGKNQRRFERLILQSSERYNLQEVAYDRFRAKTFMTRLERKGLTVVPVKQTYEGIGEATATFGRRINAGSIILPDNPCLRWQAANVEVLPDKFGNVKPVKEGAKGRFAGRRGDKIDGIVALIIAISRAMKHEMKDQTDEALKNWSGKIELI